MNEPLILHGDARALPLADNTVDLVVTSPPYFGLRSYTDGGRHYEQQIGSEATPQQFVDALIEVTRECMRVLKPSGSMWINLGDSYSGKPAGPQGNTGQRVDRRSANEPHQAAAKRSTGDVPAKSLRGLPWRFALRCIDELGLILRAEVIWSKANSLPESVTDRVRRSHEQWFHFTKEPRYYSAVDEIREPHMFPNQTRTKGDSMNGGKSSGTPQTAPKNNPLGKLPGSVWEIASQPLRVPEELGIDHFAAFPMELPRRIITGWSPLEVCTACGEGRRPVAERSTVQPNPRLATQTVARAAGTGGTARSTLGRDASSVERSITGYVCACPHTSAPSTPGVVLDPFGGTGTTALVATLLGRTGISVDASRDYCRIAQWRANDPKERGRAAGLDPDTVAKVQREIPGQEDLFGGAA